MKKVGVALLGVGVVGGGTYEILTKKREYIKQNDGIDIEVMHVLERNTTRCDELGIDPAIVSTDITNITKNKDIKIVCEFFGGIEPARSFIIECLKAGKSVVTANKEMFSKNWPELEKIARENNAGLYFEASCVGGVPIIHALTDSMQGNKVQSIKGIVNGTTNYILSRMSDEGVDYATCLKDAQALGYAEANPTADVDGFDAMYKCSILSSLAYKKRVPLDKIYREGISQIKVEDINYGKELGYTLKLLAISKNYDKIEARVHPVFLPNEHPLSSVKGSFNAVYVNGDNVGDLMFYGRGAGALPTGSAIVSDVIFAAAQDKPRRFAWEEVKDVNDADFESEFSSKYYIRITVKDVQGVLAKVSTAFEKFNVSINAVIQKDAKDNAELPIIFVTHLTKESTMQAALKDIAEIDGVVEIAALIRVED